MVLAMSQLVEDARQNTDEESIDPDPCAESQTLGGVLFALPVSIDDILIEYIRLIATILWFACKAVMTASDYDFLTLERYAWDGEFFFGIDDLSSRI